MLEGRQVKSEKIKAVEDLAELMKKYSVIGILTLQKTPASALQKIKKDFKEEALIKVVRKSTTLFALDKAGKQNLKEFVGDSPALILSNTDPFKLYLDLQRSRVAIPAKPGDKPEEDIEVKSGPTDLPPGPAISSLTKVRIPAKVVGGKINVMKDIVVCKAGEEVSIDLSSALQLLKLKPMEAGLNVIILCEDGKVYKKEELFVDEKEIYNDIIRGIQNAFNLSINSGYPTKETIILMISKAHLSAKQLESELKIEKPEEAKGEKKEEPKPAEEKPAEEKKEEKPEEKQEEQSKEEVKEEPKSDENASLNKL